MPQPPDLPLKSSKSIDDPERRFEELAALQRKLAERDDRLIAVETELEMLRRNPSGGPAGQLQGEVESEALQIEVRQVRAALKNKELSEALLAEKLRTLSEDHQRLAEEAGENEREKSRTDLVMELAELNQKLTRTEAALAEAESRLDRTRLSGVFIAEGGGEENIAAGAERRMRLQQMAMLTAFMAGTSQAKPND